MPPESTIDTIDRERSGEVSKKILAWRLQGLSVEDITFKLRFEEAVPVVTRTVSRWLKRQEAEASFRTLLDPEAFDSEAS